MTYGKSVGIALDQFGNALAGGNPKCTISGRIGYYAVNAISKTKWFWLSLQEVVDFAFYPFDGKGHCNQAYLKEKNNEFYKLNSFKALALIVLALITTVSCVPISVISWSMFGVKKLIKLLKKK